MIDGKDIIDFAIDYGTKKEHVYLEARYIDSREEGYTTRNGALFGGGTIYSNGISIRVLTNNGIGFSSTARLEEEHVKKTIDLAIKMANNNKRKEPIKFSEEKIVNAKWDTPVKEKIEDVTEEEKIRFLTDLDKELVNQEFGENLVTRTLMLSMDVIKKYIRNSEGSTVESEKSLMSIYTFNTAKGSNGSEQRFCGEAGAMGWEWLKKENIADMFIEDNRALVKTANEAKKMKFDEVDIIVSGEVAGIIAHENTGHPSEGDRILGREGAQAGESFYIDLLKDKKLGEIKVGAECVNLIDDPTLFGSAGFYLFDDECVKARPRHLIKDGMINEVLLNREFAYKFDTKSNAAARAIGYNREPIIRMANTYFAPGEYEIDELFEDVKKGVYMKSFTEWNIDDRRFQSKYVGLEAYLIENGELTDTMIKRPILELTTFGLFGSVDAVSKNISHDFGICGKSDPSQGAPCWMGGAQVRMRNIKLGGE